MSDGALSQDEIDALLSGGGDSGGAGGTASGSEDDRNGLQTFLSSTVANLSANLSAMTGAQVSVKAPQVAWTNRDSMLQALPDMVTVTRADFSAGFPGEHSFLMAEDTAKSIASLMNKEENIELDEMAMSVIGETVSQIVGSQITALTDKTGNKSIASSSPEAANMPKATAALPGSNFIQAAYELDLGDGASHKLWEVFGPAVSSAMARSLSGGGAPQAAQTAASGFGGGMGGFAGPAGGGMPGGATNVSSIQFPNLMPQVTPQEQGNIGLIMDVYMEMTVELGRTRKSIKDILSMGEGTIIELDKLAGEPVDILVNHKLIAKGEVVVIDENFGVRVTEIVSPIERMSDLN
ncbi:flagellar motor switch protein FliN [Spirochaetia bacterium]|nr:flagellar motor switch protein FliN [Spirochaetia bacterium]